MFFNKAEGIPRVVTIWLSLCIIVLSPVRYICLQLTMGTAYPVQSISAILSSLLVALYLWIVLFILYAIGFYLPLLVTLFAGMREPVTKARMVLLCVLAPVGCLLSSFLVTILLPYAAMSIHWLKVKDVIRSTNGPAFYFHQLAVEIWNPMDLFVDEDQRNQNLREHIYTVYFGEKQKASYRRALTVQHFRQSLSYAWDAFETHEDGIVPKLGGLIGTVDQEVIDEVVRLEKLALAESSFVSIEELNDRYPGFGNHYRAELVAGLEAAIEGYEEGDNVRNLRGQFLLAKWGDWYAANREKIVQAKSK